MYIVQGVFIYRYKGGRGEKKRNENEVVYILENLTVRVSQEDCQGTLLIHVYLEESAPNGIGMEK